MGGILRRSSSWPAAPLRAHMDNGGDSPAAAESVRVARLEMLLEQMQHTLDVQSDRIVDLQAQLDGVFGDHIPRN